MKILIMTFGIIGLIVISGVVTASITMPILTSTDIGNQGIFNAEIGRRGSNEPVAVLEGEYKVRNRFVGFFGIATAGDKEGRFRGGLRANNFVIQIPIRGNVLTIFGRLRLDDNNEFHGIWIGRGIPVRGWISGTLIPTE